MKFTLCSASRVGRQPCKQEHEMSCHYNNIQLKSFMHVYLSNFQPFEQSVISCVMFI